MYLMSYSVILGGAGRYSFKIHHNQLVSMLSTPHRLPAVVTGHLPLAPTTSLQLGDTRPWETPQSKLVSNLLASVAQLRRL